MEHIKWIFSGIGILGFNIFWALYQDKSVLGNLESKDQIFWGINFIFAAIILYLLLSRKSSSGQEVNDNSGKVFQTGDNSPIADNSSTNNSVNQHHSGSGDNVAGDKIVGK